jgi:peptidoglycan hydrolase CwlO-like protein
VIENDIQYKISKEQLTKFQKSAKFLKGELDAVNSEIEVLQKDIADYEANSGS